MSLTSSIRLIIIIPTLIIVPFSIFSQKIPFTSKCQVVHSANQNFEEWLAHRKSSPTIRSEEVFQIPVVVHVIHSGEPIGEGYNISEEQIVSQIRVLNEDFRRKPGTRGFNEHPDGADAQIEFILAQTSPEGRATNGIVRVDFNSKEEPAFGASMVALGAYYSIWNPDEYLNIWAFPGFQDTGLGEARFPVSDLPGLEGESAFEIPGLDSLNGIPISKIDGVAINSIHFGESTINSNYNLGRTGTHEVGHFLGLFHVWGDEGFEGSCEIDDYCEDTPNTASRTTGCPVGKLACDNTQAMIENYMDYTNDECMNIFTQDQVDRMRTVLENSPRRKSLLTSKGLFPPDAVSKPREIFQSFNIYPNPVKDLVFIELTQSISYNWMEVSIFTLSGLQVGKTTSYSFPRQIITHPLPEGIRGILILVIQTDRGILRQKLYR